MSRLIEFIMFGMVLEGAVLLAWHRRVGRGIEPRALLANLAAGGCLLLAMRLSLAGANWIWIASCLAGALTAHIADLRQRWVAYTNRPDA